MDNVRVWLVHKYGQTPLKLWDTTTNRKTHITKRWKGSQHTVNATKADVSGQCSCLVGTQRADTTKTMGHDDPLVTDGTHTHTTAITTDGRGITTASFGQNRSGQKVSRSDKPHPTTHWGYTNKHDDIRTHTRTKQTQTHKKSKTHH